MEAMLSNREQSMLLNPGVAVLFRLACKAQHPMVDNMLLD